MAFFRFQFCDLRTFFWEGNFVMTFLGGKILKMTF